MAPWSVLHFFRNTVIHEPEIEHMGRNSTQDKPWKIFAKSHIHRQFRLIPLQMPRPLLLLVLCLLAAAVPCLECGRAKTIDYEALEKAWEAGDAEEELLSEGDEHYRQLQNK